MKLAVVICNESPFSTDRDFRIVNAETGEVLDGVSDARWSFEAGMLPKLEVTIYGVVCWSVEELERRKQLREGQGPASGMGTARRIVGIEG